MTLLNAAANAFLAIAITIWCLRAWKKGTRIAVGFLALFAAWLFAAAIARWARGMFGPNDYVTAIQTYAWFPRALAAVGIIWREALNGHADPERALKEVTAEIEARVGSIRGRDGP